MNLKIQLTAAIDLPTTATAAEIYTVLKQAPTNSSAHYLLRALNGERAEETKHYCLALRPFIKIDNDFELEEALLEGLISGGRLIDSAFCEALNADSERRGLVNYEGTLVSRCTLDAFGEPFDLKALMQANPFGPPFGDESAQALNSGWGFTPTF
ncbi:MAG: hypothetical protein Q8N51_00190 [Gammaproteobacteria bacterium]|nr:hypothetical protein [Gammaproteobacteria bacterium]